MKLTSIFKFFVIVVLAFSQVSCEKEDQERTVGEKDVPQAVLQAFNTAFPGATVKEYAEETEHGQKCYEISCEFEGRKIDASYKPDGTVAAIEEVIPTEQLPEVINQAITKEFPDFSIRLAEKIEKEGKTFFEVKILNTTDQKMYELQFSATGQLVEKEQKRHEEKEADEESAEPAETEEHETGMKISVPEGVALAFKTKFDAATEVAWGKESATEFEAEFKLNGKEMSANFDATGNWLETESKLSREELPEAVLGVLKSQFSDYQFEKAERLEKPGKPVVFEVKLEKGETLLELLLDENGNVINKEIRNEPEEEHEEREKE